MAEPMLPEEFPVGKSNSEESTKLIEDVLLCIFQELAIPDLITCRLVNKFWCTCATKTLKPRTKPVKISRNMHCKNLKSFENAIVNRDTHRLLPYGKYHIDISQKIAQCEPYFSRIFDQISLEKCHKLKLIFHFRPESHSEAKKAAESRNGNMSFVNLENLEFKIRFYEGFSTQFVNMEEILQQSKGLKKVNLSLSSYISTEAQHPIVSNILTCFTDVKNNFRNVATLGLDYSYLTTAHLKILTDWKHPVKNLALGTFDLKPDRRYGFPGEALTEFLQSRSDTLVNLRIKVYKEYAWEDVIEDQMEMNLIVDEDIIHFPPAPQRSGRVFPVRATLPKMPKLQSFEILAAHTIDTRWAWRLEDNSLPELFPSLKKFSLIQFHYSVGDSPGFMPKLNHPSHTVETVTLPDAKDAPDPVLLHHMISLFPKVRCLEMHFNRMTFEKICLSLDTLEKLVMHMGEELVHLDSVLTGAPSLQHKIPLYEKEAEIFNIEAVRSRPSILELKNLQELFLTTEDYYVRITDVTAYHVFLKMKKFSKLTIHAYPWEDNTKWTFSDSCFAKLQEQVRLTLKIFKMCRREKFFNFP